MTGEPAFEVLTPLGLLVICTRERWEYIATVKHPVLGDRMAEVMAALAEPLEVRRSTRDAAVLLFYRAMPARLLCAVVRAEDGEGSLVTAYPTDRLKRGGTVWSASG